MAIRPVFVTANQKPYFDDKLVEFTYHSGFSIVQTQKSMDGLHSAFLSLFPQYRVLEISSKSRLDLGVKLSAFNLSITTLKSKEYSVETLFQASKVFENGGPYEDLLEKSPREAKSDSRLKTSGSLKCFRLGNRTFPLSPKTYFYDWLYVNALHLHQDLVKPLVEYDAFSDIVFNPIKSINCQARSAAIYVSLYREGLLNDALKNEVAFLNTVYGDPSNNESYVPHKQLYVGK